MKAKRFTYDFETYYKVHEAGHYFTVYAETPARFYPILSDGHPVSLPACPTLSDAVALALSHCL